MAFNPYFPTGYQPYYPQVGTQMSQAQQGQQQGIIWVQGESGAKSYLVAPNQTVQLWDSESQTIYLKSADASGMPSIRILDYTMRNNAPKQNVMQSADYATREEVGRLEEEIKALKARLEDESVIHGTADKHSEAEVR